MMFATVQSISCTCSTWNTGDRTCKLSSSSETEPAISSPTFHVKKRTSFSPRESIAHAAQNCGIRTKIQFKNILCLHCPGNHPIASAANVLGTLGQAAYVRQRQLPDHLL